jgi:hypothetical protein
MVCGIEKIFSILDHLFEKAGSILRTFEKNGQFLRARCQEF